MTRSVENPTAVPWANLIAHRLQSLRFGTIQLTVHDGRIVQVDFTERTRLEYPATVKGGDRPEQGH